MESSTTDFSSIITEIINNLFSNLFSSIDNTTYAILDDITFVDSSIISDDIFKNILGISANSGILIIANTLLFGLLLYYSISLLISHITGSEIQSPKDFIFKAVIYGILMNASYFICEQIININSLISLAIRNIGEITYQKNICFETFVNETNSFISISKSSFNLFSIDGIIKSFSSLGLLNLIFSYSLRYILIKVFILISPFSFLSLIYSKTKWIFSSWIKIIMSLLLLQDFIPIILLICFSFSYSNNFISKLFYMGCIYALIKANSILKEFIGGISTNTDTPMKSLNLLFRR
ncbi:MAG: hypothetical protein IJ223_03905 [Clostridia bacterium]|nr:hypothetical protein [Clostridia bacterium]